MSADQAGEPLAGASGRRPRYSPARRGSPRTWGSVGGVGAAVRWPVRSCFTATRGLSLMGCNKDDNDGETREARDRDEVRAAARQTQGASVWPCQRGQLPTNTIRSVFNTTTKSTLGGNQSWALATAERLALRSASPPLAASTEHYLASTQSTMYSAEGANLPCGHECWGLMTLRAMHGIPCQSLQRCLILACRRRPGPARAAAPCAECPRSAWHGRSQAPKSPYPRRCSGRSRAQRAQRHWAVGAGRRGARPAS